MSGGIEQLYGEFWGSGHRRARELIQTTLHPRDDESLYDLFAQTGCGPDDLIFDIGCRDAKHAIELARRFGCRVTGIDAVPYNIAIASELITNWSLEGQISVIEGRIEALPYDDATVDHIWCRDMLNHVDLPTGIRECYRVLKPGGQMLVYQTFAGDHLEPGEATRIYEALSIVPGNMSTEVMESAVTNAGFQIEVRDLVASEWRESWIETGDMTIATDLLQIARMRRAEHAMVEHIGRAQYEAELAVRLWSVYQLLGKLIPVAYLLRKP
jgi:SAM-dependent methyltransferase